MNKYDFIKTILNTFYKNTICFNNEFKENFVKDWVKLFLKEKYKKLYTRKIIDYINNYKFN
jgi:hypothetical protein